MGYFGIERWITGELAGTTEAGGVSQTVGHDVVAALNYSGADISTNIANAAGSGGSLAAPDDWTDDLVNFDIGSPFTVFIKGYSSAVAPISIIVASTEDAGDGVRMQILVDGVVVWDQTVVKDATEQSAQPYGYLQSGEPNNMSYYAFNCQDSFQIKVTRVGTFGAAASDVYIGQTHYVKYQ